MKHLLLFCMGLCLSAFVYAQTAKYNTSLDKLKVTLSKDSLFIIYKNQEIPAANILVLDSLLKNVSAKENLAVEFEHKDGEPKKIRSIEAILKQCNCHITTHSIKYNKH